MIVDNDQQALIHADPESAQPGRRSAATAWTKYGFNDWSTWALLLNGVLLALFFLWLPYRPEEKSDSALVEQLTNLLPALALELQLVLCMVAWRASTSAHLTRRRKLGWRFFSLACFVYWVGNLLYFYYYTILKVSPFPSFADAGYLAFYPLALAGLLCFREKLDTKTDQARFWLDAITVVVGMGTLVWYFLLQPLAEVRYNSTLELLLTLGYPVGDTLLMFGITVLLLRYRRGRSGKPLAWLVAGMSVHFVADTSFAYQTLQGTYASAGINGALYNTAYFLMLVGAHLEFRTPYRTDLRETTDRKARSFNPLPYAAVAVAYGLLLFVSRGQWGTLLGGLIAAAVTLTA